MTINQLTINGKWLEIKGEIQKAWGKLTADEIEQTKGDLKAIAGLVHQRCGEAQETFNEKFSTIVESANQRTEAAIQNVKDTLKS